MGYLIDAGNLPVRLGCGRVSGGCDIDSNLIAFPSCELSFVLKL